MFKQLPFCVIWIVPGLICAAHAAAQQPGYAGRIILAVPADAVVHINNRITHSKGTERRFESGGLRPGNQYHFTIRVTTKHQGKALEQTKRIALQAGQQVKVAFTLKEMAAMNRVRKPPAEPKQTETIRDSAQTASNPVPASKPKPGIPNDQASVEPKSFGEVAAPPGIAPGVLKAWTLNGGGFLGSSAIFLGSPDELAKLPDPEVTFDLLVMSTKSKDEINEAALRHLATFDKLRSLSFSKEQITDNLFRLLCMTNLLRKCPLSC